MNREKIIYILKITSSPSNCRKPRPRLSWQRPERAIGRSSADWAEKLARVPARGAEHMNVRCLRCGQKNKITTGLEGKEVACSHCGRSLAVPFPAGDQRYNQQE